MENKIIIITGLSGAGKSFIYGKIYEQFLHFETLIQTTTRPKRDYEVDGIDYHFHNNEKFDELLAKGLIVGHRIYNTKFKGIEDKWQYGIDTTLLLEDESYIFAGDVRLQKQLKEVYGDRLISIFIDADSDVRKDRAKTRGNFSIIEWERRELEDFHLIQEGYELSDIVFNNNKELTEEKLENLLEQIMNKIGE